MIANLVTEIFVKYLYIDKKKLLFVNFLSATMFSKVIVYCVVIMIVFYKISTFLKQHFVFAFVFHI